MKNYIKRFSRIAGELIIFIVCSLILKGCSTGENNDFKILRIGASGSDDSYVMELAKVAYLSNYLDEELNKIGYKAEVVPFIGAGTEINEALASGGLDAAVYGDLAAFVSKSKDIDTKIIAETNSKQTFGIITSTDDIEEPKDLEGKKVIVPQGTLSQYFWDQYCKENCIDMDSIEVINTIDALSLLQTKDADAYVINLNVAKFFECLGVGTVFDDSSSIKSDYSSIIFTVQSNLLESDSELGVAIDKALIRSYDVIKKNPQALYDALASKCISAEIMKTGYDFDPSLSYMSPEVTDEVMAHYNKLNSWLIDNSLIQDKIDIGEFIDRSYYKRALAELNEEM